MRLARIWRPGIAWLLPVPFVLGLLAFGVDHLRGMEPARSWFAPVMTRPRDDAIEHASPRLADLQSDIFQRLRGDWRGEGTLMGRAARFTMRWESGDGFAMLVFSNAFVDTAGNATPVLNAAAVYRTSAEQPEAVWLDSRGERVEIEWEASDSLLVANWTAPRERGRTTYRVLSSDELEVVDEVMSGEAWRTFGRARYTRAQDAGPDAGREQAGGGRRARSLALHVGDSVNVRRARHAGPTKRRHA